MAAGQARRLLSKHNPTLLNLLGCSGRESEMGALVTDFTLIRSGQPAKGKWRFSYIAYCHHFAASHGFEGLLRALAFRARRGLKTA